ncbi:MAG: NAD(P)-dependent oxidoreductase [Micromonosporaceae bacterium]|nr:NAD(P)-dependent oxidoreductase [Micromonosporaceae bacterium]
MAGTLEPVAVLGLGAMGRRMAHRALRAGIPTIVWNRHQEATRDLAEAGAQVADTAADAALRAGIVVTMVSDAEAVGSIAREQGLLAALRPDAIWAQMSSIGVAATDKLVDLVRTQRRDVTFIDAPVVGSREPAERGELLILASGPQAVGPRLNPLFNALGHTIWVGPVGTGTRLKVVNNTWLAFASEAVVASLAVARRLGLSTEAVTNLFADNPVASPWQRAKLQRVSQGEYEPQFSLALALKDVRLAQQVTDDDQFVALAGLAEEWQRAAWRGLGDQDLTVVHRTLEPHGAMRPGTAIRI